MDSLTATGAPVLRRALFAVAAAAAAAVVVRVEEEEALDGVDVRTLSEGAASAVLLAVLLKLMVGM